MDKLKSYLKRKRIKRSIQLRQKQARQVKRSQMFIYMKEEA